MSEIKIDIGIRRKHPRVRRPGPGDKRGPIDFEDGPEHLKRRNRGAFLNFWDMGQVWDGSAWVDITYSVSPQITSVSPFNVFVNSFQSVLANWETLRDLLLAPATSTWDTLYKKLSYEEAERYAVDFFDSNTSTFYPAARNGSRYDFNGNVVADTKWKAKGLQVGHDVEFFYVLAPAAFISFNNVPDDFKVTTGPTYGSTEVDPFVLSKKADIFLAPRVNSFQGVSERSTSTQEVQLLAGDFGAMKRSFWLNKNDSVHGFPLLSYFPGVLGPTISAGDKTALIAHVTGGGAREFRQEFQAVPTVLFPFSEGSPGSFPGFAPFDRGNRVYINAGPGGLPPTAITGSPQVVLQEGTFAGAIRQGRVFYYFWSRVSQNYPGTGEFNERIIEV